MYARRLHRWAKKIQTEEEIDYDFESVYPTRLSLYLEPPLLEISMDEFEQCAFDRMQILTTLQNCQMRNLTPEQLDKTMKEAFEKFMPMTLNTPDRQPSHERLVNERLKDHIGHYILRLAYCRSPELRAWFLKAECALFKYRFDKESLEDQIAFLEHQNLFWRRLSDDDKRLLHDKLLECYVGAKYNQEFTDDDFSNHIKRESDESKLREERGKADGIIPRNDEGNGGRMSKKRREDSRLDSESEDEAEKRELRLDFEDNEEENGAPDVNIDDIIFFELDFERVPGLIGRREIYIKDGKAYVPMAEQVTMVLDIFKERLSDSLEACALALPGMDEDDRLVPVLDNINDQYLGKDYTTASIAGELQAGDIDGLAFHMPPCMEQLHTELRNAKHLRHGGRMQYGLFLKGIGLPLEQALLFWQKAFGNHTAEQFNKEYAYNIRHSYGMEGKRTDYTPYSCKGIIMNTAPGPGDHHGCPFRHWPAQKLRESLSTRGLDEFDQEDVMQFVQGKHYQLACTRYFEVTRAKKMNIPIESLRGGLVDDGGSRIASQETIEHPNQFFEQSYLLFQKSTKRPANGTAGDMEVDEEPATLAPIVRGGYTYKKAGQAAPAQPAAPLSTRNDNPNEDDEDEV